MFTNLWLKSRGASCSGGNGDAGLGDFGAGALWITDGLARGLNGSVLSMELSPLRPLPSVSNQRKWITLLHFATLNKFTFVTLSTWTGYESIFPSHCPMQWKGQ